MFAEQECQSPPGRTEQEQRYMNLFSKFKRFDVYGKLLFVHVEDGTVLLLQTG